MTGPQDADGTAVDGEVVDGTAVTEDVVTKDVVDAEIVEEPVRPVLPAPDYSDGGVPSFDYVRDRIESRAGTSAASVDLAGLGGSGPTAKSLDEQMAEREEAGRAKLAEIRRSMGLDT